MFREIFDDPFTKIAGVVFVLIVGVVAFNHFSDLPYRYPLFGIFSFSLVPILFGLGGLIFVLALLRLCD